MNDKQARVAQELNEQIKCICIIGLGLIGGSFAQALKSAGYIGRITGVIRSASTGDRALELGVVDDVSNDSAAAASNADLIMLAVPMLAMREQMELIRDAIKPNAIITDAGSVKGNFIEEARAVFGSLEQVVPGHPIAGSERSGIDAVNAALFNDRRVLLTPASDTNEHAVTVVQRLWQSTGAIVERMTPERHDRVLAATSHLPHVLAFALVDTLATQHEAEEIFRFAAGGFRDFTRIASSDAIMWRDICLTNRDAVCDSIDALDEHLQRLRAAIARSDGDVIEQTFKRARAARDTHT